MQRVRQTRPLLLLALPAVVAVLALAAGCGGGGESSTGHSTTTSAPPAEQSEAPGGKGGGTNPSSGGGEHQGKAPEQTAEAGDSGAEGQPKRSIAEEEEESSDQSIQEFGSEAEGEEAEAVVAAMRSYIQALATRDYAAVCDGLLAANRQQLAQFAKMRKNGPEGCEGVLKTLLSPATAAEAKKTLGATISKVRVDEGHAFVLFRPPGGKVSYVVLEEEDGSWKATSLAPGAPLVP